jgi:hypothetical protein
MFFRPFPAKRAGKCSHCFRSVEKGAEIIFAQGSIIGCVACEFGKPVERTPDWATCTPFRLGDAGTYTQLKVDRCAFCRQSISNTNEDQILVQETNTGLYAHVACWEKR